MMYHPDKNKDDLEAAEKFREITGAYEVDFPGHAPELTYLIASLICRCWETSD